MKREKLANQKSSALTWIVFFANLVLVLFTLTSVVFPALILRTMGGFENYANVNPFEIGTLALPLLIADSVIFVLLILYFKKILRPSAGAVIDFVFNFEITPKTTFIVIIVLLGVFVAFSASQLFVQEQWEDYTVIRQQYQHWTVDDFTKGFDNHIKFFLLGTGLHIFGNDRIVPFCASIAMLILVYLTTVKITGKRFSGIISMVIVLSSNVFQTYDTSPTYDNLWILFYLLSIYMILIRWPFSPVAYILSIFSKAITAVYFPMTLFFMYRCDVPRKKKCVITLSYGILATLLAVGFFTGMKIVHQGVREFSPHDFWSGFSALSFELGNDPLIIISLLPLCMGLLIASRKGVIYADSIMFFIAVLLVMPSLLGSLTPYPNEPYRFMPLIVFFAIGVGTLLSKRISQQAQV